MNTYTYVEYEYIVYKRENVESARVEKKDWLFICH